MRTDNIINELKKIKSVKSIVLAGSKSANTADEISDFDIYIYADKEIPVEERLLIAEKFAEKSEINNQFFETGDELVLKDGTVVDIMYRNPNWLEEQVKRVYIDCNASVGYSTCFLYNIKTSEVLYDPENWFKNLQDSIQEYPDKLVENIIKKNFPLLKNKLVSSYYEQIEKAVKRNDLISVNHRTAAFLASYFDILFAVNKLWHPGEKRLLKFAKNNCKLLPQELEKNITELLTVSADKKSEILTKLNADIVKLLELISQT